MARVRMRSIASARLDAAHPSPAGGRLLACAMATLGSTSPVAALSRDARRRVSGSRPDTDNSAEEGRIAAVGQESGEPTVLPEFVDPSLGHFPAQMILLATRFCVVGILSDCTWGLIAGTARDWFARSPRRLALVGGAGGLAMIGLGVGVTVTGRQD
jgi:hypothetical protein